MKRTGNPDMYLQLGKDIIGIYRKPSANGIVLELECVCIPKAYVEDTDPVKVREAFQRAAVYLSVSEFHASRGNAQRAMEYLNQYIETAGLSGIYPETAERQYQMRGNQNPPQSPLSKGGS